MFLQKLFSSVPIDARRITLVMDNHTSHHSDLVKDYLQMKGVHVLFMPPYSSPLNVQEYAWGLFKIRWAKSVAQITYSYDLSGLENDISLVMDEVS